MIKSRHPCSKDLQCAFANGSTREPRLIILAAEGTAKTPAEAFLFAPYFAGGCWLSGLLLPRVDSCSLGGLAVVTATALTTDTCQEE
jgi:hypothetical protein